jgi:hypothetical protein
MYSSSSAEELVAEEGKESISESELSIGSMKEALLESDMAAGLTGD